MSITKRFNRLICMVIGCLLLVCFVNAQQLSDDNKFKGSVRALLRTFDQNGENAAVDQARARGFRIRKKARQETLLPLILETKPGISTRAFDKAWCENKGIKVEAVSSSLIRVLVPFRLARQLSLHPQVAMIREPRKPVLFQIGMGSKVSESVVLTSASILQGQNITGNAVKVAVIDLGFIGLAAAVTSGEIPASRVIVDLVDSNNDIETETDHGTSVAEQVMDMAPGVTLYCIQISDELDFQNAAKYLAANNIHIANHSMGWINGSYYNDKGFIDSIVNASHDIDNVFWAVAAGNEAARHWRGTWTDANSNNMPEFSGTDEYMDISPSTLATSQVFLNWNQYDTVKTDLDLYLYDKNNLIVDSSTYRQPIEYPCEYVQFSYQTSREPYKIAVKWHSGPKTNLDITIFCPTNDIEYKKPGYSIVEPGCAHGAFTVAAVDQLNWRLLPPVIESISSQGPTIDGRMKPDITAPDFTSSFTTGDSAAYGTSFASPVAAGAAALLRQEYPSISVVALADTLRAIAKDVGKTGIDSVYGSGLLYLCLSAPVLISPANGTANVPLNPTLVWDTVDNAATYRVQLSTSPGFGAPVVDDSTPTTYVTSRMAGMLLNSTMYYWRVRSKNSRGVSGWSSTWSFTTLLAVPSVPVPASPSNGVSDVSLTPSLSWNTANGAATYRVQLSTSATFSTTLIDDSTVAAPATSKTAGTLSTATTYYWRVNAKNAGGTSGWSATWSFVTVPASPAAPTLASPSNGAASVSLNPSLSWNTAGGANTYRVQLSTGPSFATTVFDDSTLSATSKPAGTLINSTTYYWRTNAKNAGGTSAWSTTWSFTTVIAAPTAPVLSSPANGAINQPLTTTLAWSAVTGASTYHFQVSTSAAFSTIFLQDSTLISATSAVSGLDNSGTYYWRVRAKNAGGTSAWSAPWNFVTIPPAAGTPVLSSPANAATDLAVSQSLVWNAVSGALSYRVQLSTSSSFSTTIIDDSTVTAPATDRSTGTLTNNATYYWRVNAKNAGGTSAWSATWSFTTLPAVPSAPVLSSPANAGTDMALAPTLLWNTAGGAVTYRVQLSTASSFAATIIDDSTVTATSKAAGTLTNNTVYYWRVCAKNSGGTSAWSSIWSFTTIVAAPAVPTLSSPANAVVDLALNPTISWNTVTGVATYRVQLSTSAAFTSMVIDDSTLTTASKATASLLNSTAYYWRVNAKNAGGTSAWSSTWSFTTIIDTPPVPTLASPANAATDIVLTPTLAWNSANGAVTYRVQLSTVSTFAALVLDDSTLTTASKPAGTLANTATYYWRVNAKNAGGTSSWSSTWSFVTRPPAPSVPVLALPANGAASIALTPTLSWNAASGAVTYRVQLSTSLSFSTTLINDSTLTAVSRAAGTLSNGTTYYWRINAKNSGGTSAWSPVWSFATLPALPAVVTVLLPAAAATIAVDSAVFTWQKSQPAVDNYAQEIAHDSLMTNKVYNDSVLADTIKTRKGFVNGVYWWRVKAHNASGWGSYSAVRKFTVSIPTTAILPANYEFRLNGVMSTRSEIRYAIPVPSKVSIMIYNVQGRRVETLCNVFQSAGYYALRINLTEFPKGYYLIDFKAGKCILKKKFLVY